MVSQRFPIGLHILLLLQMVYLKDAGLLPSLEGRFLQMPHYLLRPPVLIADSDSIEGPHIDRRGLAQTFDQFGLNLIYILIIKRQQQTEDVILSR